MDISVERSNELRLLDDMKATASKARGLCQVMKEFDVRTMKTEL